jgi:hypothetical protein
VLAQCLGEHDEPFVCDIVAVQIEPAINTLGLHACVHALEAICKDTPMNSRCERDGAHMLHAHTQGEKIRTMT